MTSRLRRKLTTDAIGQFGKKALAYAQIGDSASARIYARFAARRAVWYLGELADRWMLRWE